MDYIVLNIHFDILDTYGEDKLKSILSCFIQGNVI